MRMNRRRLFSRMAQIVILILLIILAFFLIRGFARGKLHEKKRAYRSEIGDFSPIVEKWKEISASLPHAENINNANNDLAGDIQRMSNA
ncbi:MAG: hypothetical protein ACE5K2_02065 [Candidatus Zixiibacteriota bacterium]